MPIAFIIAVVIEVVTLVICGLVLFADGMSDAPSSQGISVWPPFIIGTGLALAVAGTHYVNWGHW